MKTEAAAGPLTFEELLPELHESYAAWKLSESLKNSHRAEFYELANAALKERGLAQKVVVIEATSEDAAQVRAKRHHPGWSVLSVRPAEPDHYQVLIEENPVLKPFSIEHDGWKYARTSRKGAVMVDDDWLAESDPELLGEVTFALPWGGYVMRPLEHLEAKLIGRLTKYIYNAPPTVSLAAPRQLKADE